MFQKEYKQEETSYIKRGIIFGQYENLQCKYKQLYL